MPEQQVAVVQSQQIPLLQIQLDFHLVAPDLLDGDQGGIRGGGGFHKHPALHLGRQQPLQALEFAHEVVTGVSTLTLAMAGSQATPALDCVKHCSVRG